MAVDWSQLKVLIADDQRLILDLLFHFLKESGAKSENIHRVSNGDDAAKVLASLPIDILVCDVNMGPGNRLHLLRKIRSGQAQAAPDLPVIFLTAHSDPPTVKVAMALDANGFIIKPVAKKQLQEKIEGVLANRKPLPPGKNYTAIIVELSNAVKAASAMDGATSSRKERQADRPDDDA